MNDPLLLQRLCMLGWNISLPLLQPNLRRHIYTLYNNIADSLEEIDSLYYLVRAQLHLEQAKCEMDNDLLTKAKKNVNEAIRLDYGVMEVQAQADDSPEEIQNKLRPLDRVLLPIKRKLDLKTDVYRDPNGPEEKVVLLIEQTKQAKQISVKINFLKEAIDLLTLSEVMTDENGNEIQRSKDMEEYRITLYGDIAQLSWSIRHLEFTKKCCNKVLENEWNIYKYKNIILLQCDILLILIECLVKEGKELCQSQNITESPFNLIGYVDENTPKELVDINNNIITNIIKTMKLAQSLKEKWLCENSAIYFWNYHLPYFQSNQFEKCSDSLSEGITNMISILEDVQSEDNSLLLNLYWVLLKIKEKKGLFNDCITLITKINSIGTPLQLKDIYPVKAHALIKTAKKDVANGTDGVEKIMLLISSLSLEEVTDQEKLNMIKECEKAIDESISDWDTQRAATASTIKDTELLEMETLYLYCKMKLAYYSYKHNLHRKCQYLCKLNKERFDEDICDSYSIEYYHYLSFSEMIWGQSIEEHIDMNNQSVEDINAYKKATMDHFCNSAHFGSKTNELELIVNPSKKLWNSIVPMINSVTTRMILYPYCERIINTLRNSPSNGEFKELFKNFYTSYIQSLYDNKLYDEGIKNIQNSFQVLDVVFIYYYLCYYSMIKNHYGN